MYLGILRGAQFLETQCVVKQKIIFKITCIKVQSNVKIYIEIKKKSQKRERVQICTWWIDMANDKRIMTAGVAMTEKEVAVYNAVKNAGKAVKASDLENLDAVKAFCGNLASVRSTLARLDKTHGVIASKITLENDKAVKAYVDNAADAEDATDAE